MPDKRTPLQDRNFANLTAEENERHHEAGENFHVPAIVHRQGRVSAEKLNSCGICGAQIVPDGDGVWRKASDRYADELRMGR